MYLAPQIWHEELVVHPNASTLTLMTMLANVDKPPSPTSMITLLRNHQLKSGKLMIITKGVGTRKVLPLEGSSVSSKRRQSNNLVVSALSPPSKSRHLYGGQKTLHFKAVYGRTILRGYSVELCRLNG